MPEASLQPRTYLFVPGTRPDRFGKALASGADAVILDLEDAVAPVDKDAARQAIVNWFMSAAPADRARSVVRINDAGSAWFDHDLRALRDSGVTAILLPKAETAQQIAAAPAPGRTDPRGAAAQRRGGGLGAARAGCRCCLAGRRPARRPLVDRPVVLQAQRTLGLARH
jgi:hypothetical protein